MEIWVFYVSKFHNTKWESTGWQGTNQTYLADSPICTCIVVYGLTVITLACDYHNVGFVTVYKIFIDTESVPRDLCCNPLPVVLSVLSLALVLAAHAAFQSP